MNKAILIISLILLACVVMPVVILFKWVFIGLLIIAVILLSWFYSLGDGK